MIEINFYSNGFIVKNHANYKQKGYDIVCAGISAIIMGSLTWFSENDVVDYIIDESIPIIKMIIKLNKQNSVALSLILNQVNEVHKNYKEYINVIIHDKEL